jgi:hypothetical protein
MGAPNVLQVARRYGPFVDYQQIPVPSKRQFPKSLLDYLRALTVIQQHTPTPLVMPDLTAVSVGDVEAAAQAALLVSGQAVLDEWDQLETVRDGASDDPVTGPAAEIDFGAEYQLLTFEKLVVEVGEQGLTLGTVSSLLLSVKYGLEGARLIARPYRNKTVQKNFSPLAPEAAGAPERRVLGRIIGRIDDGGA